MNFKSETEKQQFLEKARKELAYHEARMAYAPEAAAWSSRVARTARASIAKALQQTEF